MAIVGDNLAREAKETTFQNAVYLDRDGKVVDKKDPSVMTKISRQEAIRRGLIGEKVEITAPEVPQVNAILSPPETQAVTRKTTRRTK